MMGAHANSFSQLVEYPSGRIEAKEHSYRLAGGGQTQEPHRRFYRMEQQLGFLNRLVCHTCMFRGKESFAMLELS
jgi:hypothetical protein